MTIHGINYMSLDDIVLKSAQAQLLLQGMDGSMPAGINGPWNDIDTPVRNTAHCALLFHRAFKITKNDRFLAAAIDACSYLLSPEARPYNASLFCRQSKSKDQANGLIGQAWGVEPLIFLGIDLERNDYLEKAREILAKHNYNEKLHLWHNLEIDGSIGPVNITFNHQLWFAAMNLILGKKINNKMILFRARDFFSHINKALSFLEPGLIKHEIREYVNESKSSNTYKRFKTNLKRNILCPISKLYKSPANRKPVSNRLNELSIGYLTFNLYALALCYNNAKDENWWRKRFLKKIIFQIINYCLKSIFIEKTSSNKYAWGYNPCGIELAYALYSFKDFLKVSGSDRISQCWIEKQINNHWNPQTGLMNKNTIDAATFSARIYEAIRLPNIKLKVDFGMTNKMQNMIYVCRGK